MKLIDRGTQFIAFDDSLEQALSEGKPIEHPRDKVGLTDLVFVSKSMSDTILSLVTGMIAEDQNPFDFLKVGQREMKASDKLIMNEQYKNLYLLVDFLTNGPLCFREGKNV